MTAAALVDIPAPRRGGAPVARKRFLVPEIRRSRTVRSWPWQVRWAWDYLLLSLDDEGRAPDDLAVLRSEMFPDLDVTAGKLDGWLTLMCQVRPDDPDQLPALCRYEVDGGRYLHAVKWHLHQNPSHPTPSAVPPCPAHLPFRRRSGKVRERRTTSSGAALEVVANDSGAIRETLASDSGAPHEGLVTRARAELGSVRNGEEELLAPAAPTRRKQDPLWDALLAACNVVEVTDSARGAYNKAVGDLRKLAATPENIALRAKRFKERWPDASLTPTALARRWGELEPAEPDRRPFDWGFGMGPGAIRTFEIPAEDPGGPGSWERGEQ